MGSIARPTSVSQVLSLAVVLACNGHGGDVAFDSDHGILRGLSDRLSLIIWGSKGRLPEVFRSATRASPRGVFYVRPKVCSRCDGVGAVPCGAGAAVGGRERRREGGPER